MKPTTPPPLALGGVAVTAALKAERASAYDALTEQGRSAADVSGNLENGINWERLAHSAEVTGLVEELALVRGERDRLASTVQRVRDLTRSTDGDDLDGDSELPVGLFQGALGGDV